METYFGLREIRVASDERGLRRIFLNGKPEFQVGVLDQGFWPDGLYTAPSDEALRYDLEMTKELGFNMVRKHVKVEPARWYYWADKLGVLVWQDMPSGNNATEAGRRGFRMELERMMAQRFNHPSIVMWVLFNEGWGQFDTERLTEWVKRFDPSRVADSASGWIDKQTGDIFDLHSYPGPEAPGTGSGRAAVLGEFGGVGLTVSNHAWSATTWAYEKVESASQLNRRYHDLLQRVWSLEGAGGLSAAIYTQLTDVETECNGLITYDREVVKLEPELARVANLGHVREAPPTMILTPGAYGRVSWRYSFEQPASRWNQPGFRAAKWHRSRAPSAPLRLRPEGRFRTPRGIPGRSGCADFSFSRLRLRET